jgi:hypothetical protein
LHERLIVDRQRRNRDGVLDEQRTQASRQAGIDAMAGSKKHRRVLVWMRRAIRVDDNAALWHAMHSRSISVFAGQLKKAST